MKYQLILVFIFYLFASSVHGKNLVKISAASNDGTNIILIYADDLGYGHLGVYGQKKIKTPRLDVMAQNGLIFKNFYAGGPYCYASRISMLTGRHLGQALKMRRGFIADSLESPEYIPRYLQKAGYKTGIFGKWGFGTCDNTSFVAEQDPFSVGFDEFLGHLNHRGAHTYTIPPYPLLEPVRFPIDDRLWVIKNGRTIKDNADVVPYTHDLFVQKGLEFITRHQKENFFLYLPITIPHAELYVPKDRPGENILGQYLDSNGKSIFPEIPWQGSELFSRPVAEPRATFAAMVSRMDRDVGRILDKLKELGIDKKTLVIFTSDNGPHDAGGIKDPLFFNGAGGLTGMKWQLYEGGIRIPMIVYWPETITAGRTESSVFSQSDFLKTFTDLADISISSQTTGVSLLPTFLNSGQQASHEYLYWQSNARYKGLVFAGEAIRAGKWKAIRKGITQADDRVMLYDLETDPFEKNDIAHLSPEHKEIVEKLKKKMAMARTDQEGRDSGLYKLVSFESSKK